MANISVEANPSDLDAEYENYCTDFAIPQDLGCNDHYEPVCQPRPYNDRYAKKVLHFRLETSASESQPTQKILKRHKPDVSLKVPIWSP